MGSILVAGLDPAFAHFGIARMHLDLDTLGLSLERVRTIVTEKMAGKRKVVRQNSDDLRRARELHQALHEELEGCVVAFGEIPSGTQHSRSALGFGVALGVLASCKIPIIEVMPIETKLASVGTKTAEKPEIIAWAAERYPQAGWVRYAKDTRNKTGRLINRAGDLHVDNEHAADACAVIHAGVITPEFRQLLALWKATSANAG
jgi:Holliday junction resolvasome RuvABC endonuclease subunit